VTGGLQCTNSMGLSAVQIDSLNSEPAGGKSEIMFGDAGSTDVYWSSIGTTLRVPSLVPSLDVHRNMLEEKRLDHWRSGVDW
jgi:hypothetical protein